MLFHLCCEDVRSADVTDVNLNAKFDVLSILNVPLSQQSFPLKSLMTAAALDCLYNLPLPMRPCTLKGSLHKQSMFQARRTEDSRK